MIWVAEPEKDAGRTFQTAVEQDLISVCPALRSDGEWCSQLAQTIRDFCESGFANYVMPTDYYGLVLARVLWAVGQQESGERAVTKWCKPDVAAVCSPFDRSFCKGQAPWAMCQSGIIRSSHWLSMGESCGWIIDFNKLNVNPDETMELMFFALLGRLLNSIVRVWDDSRGQGWLGLKGLDQLAQSIYCKNQVTDALFLEDEMVSFATGILKCACTTRGWTSVPDVKRISM